MADETNVQTFVHALEEGGWVSRIRFAVLVAAVAAVYCIFIFAQFRGLNHPKAMDQAQIARELASGNGFTTKFIRPLAIWQFERNGHVFPVERTPDTYHAPLNPAIESLCLRLVKNSWVMTPKDLVYTCDRVIAAVSMVFFLLAVGVNFTIAKRLFDRRLALLGMGLILVSDVFWQFSISGLPQMLMLLIFSGTTYVLLRAIEARQAGGNALLWLVLAGVGFGLLALAHGLTIWMFGGALVFVSFSFWPSAGTFGTRFVKNPALVMLAVFLVIYTPWLVRNYNVCGSPFGVGAFSGLYQIRGTESQVMRANALVLIDVGPATFRNKITGQAIAQLSNLFGYLGHSLVAPAFFLALLHAFKKPETASFRWCVFWMWLFALAGMSAFGLEETTGVHANDLHVLFIPLMIFYGLAFVLVLWSRLLAERPQLNVKLARIAFVVMIYLISAGPLLHTLTNAPMSRVQWPPYVPPFIAILNTWTSDNEIIASDMPWAVAWYANRRSLWLPETIADFIALNDYNQLGGRIVGLYLTPITGDKALLSDIVRGEYKDWSPFILRNVNAKDFPLRAVTALPIEGECIYFSDRDRWSEHTD